MSSWWASNDGMLHAFDAGSPISGGTRDLDCNLRFDTGTGGERWAFIPPDMLPRLKDLLDLHQYTVDGNVMLRDVWVDANGDRTKQKAEFHTVAIFSERAGGTQYVALDVTNVDAPVMLWTFPPPGSVEAQWMGQSWSDFSPRPPPVGPVRIALPAGQTDTVNNRNFEERWIAMLNGGYDPTLSSGNAVWMVDVWRGTVLWRFTDDDFKSQNGYGSGTSMYAVPGAVALADIGDPSQAQLRRRRLLRHGHLGRPGRQPLRGALPRAGPNRPLATGRVSNWYAARTFEQQRRDRRPAVRDRARAVLLHDRQRLRARKKALHAYAGQRQPGTHHAAGRVLRPRQPLRLLPRRLLGGRRHDRGRLRRLRLHQPLPLRVREG